MASQYLLTPADIITKFELQVSDITELSSQEELDLLQNVYEDVSAQLPWEALKTSVSGSLSLDGTTGLYYLTVPEDFAFFSPNNQTTDNADEIPNNAVPAVVFIGTNYSPYQVINYSDRRQYRNRTGFCWLDLNARKVWFTTTPPEMTYEFDYQKAVPTLALSDTFFMPDRFACILQYGMARDNSIIQLSDRAKSYLAENNAKYEQTLLDMKYWNSQFQMN